MPKKPRNSQTTSKGRLKPIAKKSPEESDRVFHFGFREKEYPSVYINNAQFSGSDMDMRIDLCEIQESKIEPNGTESVVVTPKVRVYMSWPFAAKFLAVMKQQFDNHQQSMRAMLEKMKQQQASELSTESSKK